MKTLKLIKDDLQLRDIKESEIADEMIETIRESKSPYLGIRTMGKFADIAIWLDNQYDYVLGKDDGGNTILVPLKKGCCK